MNLRQAQAAGLAPKPRTGNHACAICHKTGHNRRTCPYHLAIPIRRMTLAEVRELNAR